MLKFAFREIFFPIISPSASSNFFQFEMSWPEVRYVKKYFMESQVVLREEEEAEGGTTQPFNLYFTHLKNEWTKHPIDQKLIP